MNQPVRNQTAVEWLFTNLLFLVFSKETTSEDYRKCLAEAKAMEREQIEQAYKAGYDMRDCCNWEGNILWDYDVKNEVKLKDYCNKALKGGEQ